MVNEWQPVNPCPCGAIRYPDSHKCNAEDIDCTILARYEGAIRYQRKLLEYLIRYAHHAKLMTVEVVIKRKLEDMLGQIEESNANNT